MNNLSSPFSDDGLTSSVSYKWSTMGASMDEDTYAKSWMEGSPKMLGKNGGGSNEKESSFTECWYSSSQSYSSWMIVCVAYSSFTTSVESGMEEHKIASSRGLAKYEDGACGTKCIWKLDELTTKSTLKLSEVMLGGCDGWTHVWAWSPASLYSGGVVRWGDDRWSLVTMIASISDCTTPSLNNTEQGLISNLFLGQAYFLM